MRPRVSRQQESGANLVVRCPLCGYDGEALARDVREKITYLFVPLVTKVTTWVECRGCGKQLLCRMRVAEFERLSPQARPAQLTDPWSGRASFWAVFAILTCWIPMGGLMVSIPAVVMSWHRTGWVRVVSQVALAIGLCAMILMILAIAMSGS